MLCLARSHVGACVMDMTFGLLLIATIISMYLAGRIAERRGRSFKNWACIAGFLLGPLALPLLFLMPNLHRKNGEHA
jgi:MFS family permease